jgi:hypothetical protein
MSNNIYIYSNKKVNLYIYITFSNQKVIYVIYVAEVKLVHITFQIKNCMYNLYGERKICITFSNIKIMYIVYAIFIHNQMKRESERHKS